MVWVGVVAVDGTKIAANAAWDSAHTAAALAHQLAEKQQAFTELAAQLLGAQVATDEAEDALHGDQRGDELPAPLRRRRQRRERLEAAQAELAAREEAARVAMLAEQKAKQAAYDEAERTGTARGPRPKDEVKTGPPRSRASEPRASVTDPQSRRMKARHGFVQGYNAQIATDAGQVILGGMVNL